MSGKPKPTKVTKEIGLRIKKARKKIGITAVDFSKIVDIAASSVSDWEAGRAAFPANQIYNLAKKLGVSPSWLLTGEGEMERKPKEHEKGE